MKINYNNKKKYIVSFKWFHYGSRNKYQKEKPTLYTVYEANV